MSATARAPLVRAGPGVSALTTLPERDRAILMWLVPGDVYLEVEERTDCVAPTHTVVSVIATDAASLERVTVLLVDELATLGCTRVV